MEEEHRLIGTSCSCGRWSAVLGESLYRGFDKHLIVEGGKRVAQPGYHLTRALNSVSHERLKQLDKGYTPEHDDQHTLGGLLRFGGLASSPATHSASARVTARQYLVRMAAVLIAGIEWIDRLDYRESEKEKNR